MVFAGPSPPEAESPFGLHERCRCSIKGTHGGGGPRRHQSQRHTTARADELGPAESTRLRKHFVRCSDTEAAAPAVPVPATVPSFAVDLVRLEWRLVVREEPDGRGVAAHSASHHSRELRRNISAAASSRVSQPSSSNSSIPTERVRSPESPVLQRAYRRLPVVDPSGSRVASGLWHPSARQRRRNRSSCRRGTGTSSRAWSAPATRGRSCCAERPELPEHRPSMTRAGDRAGRSAGRAVGHRLRQRTLASTGTPRRSNTIVRLRWPLTQRASSIGVDARVTSPDARGKPEAGATEQRDPGRLRVHQSAAPLLQTAVFSKRLPTLSSSQRQLTPRAATRWIQPFVPASNSAAMHENRHSSAAGAAGHGQQCR